jgi:hypothetical protein
MEAKGCAKGGCIGCAAVVAAVVVVPLLLVATARLTEREPEPRREELTRQLPPLPGTAAGGGAEGGAAGAGEPPAEAPPAGVPLGAVGAEVPALAAGAAPVRIVLELSKGSFEVEPGPPGSELRVEADYDAAAYRLEQRYDPDHREYELRFDSKGMLRVHFGGRHEVQSRVRLIIPRGYPVALAGHIKMGESTLDLGGLTLTEADLDLGMGSHRVDFSSPLAAPAARLSFDGSMGEMEIEHLGNASPAQVYVHHSFGSLRVDLSGRWRNDSTLDVTCGFGECAIEAPEDANLAVERARVRLGDKTVEGLDRLRPARPGVPTLHLSVESTAGELRID